MITLISVETLQEMYAEKARLDREYDNSSFRGEIEAGRGIEAGIRSQRIEGARAITAYDDAVKNNPDNHYLRFCAAMIRGHQNREKILVSVRQAKTAGYPQKPIGI